MEPLSWQRPGSYVTLSRTWQNSDRLDIQLLLKLRMEALPGNSGIVAVLFGPIVLVGELGTNSLPNPYAKDQTDLVRVSDPTVPSFVGDVASVLKMIKPNGTPLVIRTRSLGLPNNVWLAPLYRVNHERYSVCWNLVSPADAKKSSAAISAGVQTAMRKAPDGNR